MLPKFMLSKSMFHSDRGHPASSRFDLVFGSVGAAIALVLLTGSFALGVCREYVSTSSILRWGTLSSTKI